MRLSTLLLPLFFIGQITLGYSQNENLKITKMVVKNSIFDNEFGNKSDWFEIKNTSSELVDLTTAKWFVSDDIKRPRKTRLPKLTLEPNETIIIWCDDEDRFKNQIHTNFKLSSRGEDVVLSKVESKKLQIVDSVSFPELQENSQVIIHCTNDGLVCKPMQTESNEVLYTDSE